MDYPLPPTKRNALKWFCDFQLLDLIPYSLALLLTAGSIYIVTTVIALTHHTN